MRMGRWGEKSGPALEGPLQASQTGYLFPDRGDAGPGWCLGLSSGGGWASDQESSHAESW